MIDENLLLLSISKLEEGDWGRNYFLSIAG